MYLTVPFPNAENEQKEQDASIERLDRDLDQTRDKLAQINDRRKTYIYFHFFFHFKKNHHLFQQTSNHTTIWIIIKNDN